MMAATVRQLPLAFPNYRVDTGPHPTSGETHLQQHQRSLPEGEVLVVIARVEYEAMGHEEVQLAVPVALIPFRLEHTHHQRAITVGIATEPGGHIRLRLPRRPSKVLHQAVVGGLLDPPDLAAVAAVGGADSCAVYE